MFLPSIGSSFEQVLQKGTKSGSFSFDEDLIDVDKEIEVLFFWKHTKEFKDSLIRWCLKFKDIFTVIFGVLEGTLFQIFLFLIDLFKFFTNVFNEFDYGLIVVIISAVFIWFEFLVGVIVVEERGEKLLDTVFYDVFL